MTTRYAFHGLCNRVCIGAKLSQRFWCVRAMLIIVILVCQVSVLSTSSTSSHKPLPFSRINPSCDAHTIILRGGRDKMKGSGGDEQVGGQDEEDEGGNEDVDEKEPTLPQDDKETEDYIQELVGVLTKGNARTEEEAYKLIEQMVKEEHEKEVKDGPSLSQIRAIHELVMGHKAVSPPWMCLRCGQSAPALDGHCPWCLSSRSMVEKQRSEERVEVQVPRQVASIPEALKKTQDGLMRDEWNQLFRVGVIHVGRGNYQWKGEVEVFNNMMLHLVGSDGAEACGRWWFLDDSRGVARGMTFNYKHPHRPPFPLGVPMPHIDFDERELSMFLDGKHPQFDLRPEEDLVHSLIDVWGGPWFLEECSILAADALAVACASEGNVTLNNCRLGGCDLEDNRGAGCVDCSERSVCLASRCWMGNLTTGATAVRSTQEATCRMYECYITNCDWGTTVDLEGCIEANRCEFDDCIWGAWYVGFVADKTSMRLIENRVMGPGWYNEQRPGKLVEEGNVINMTRLENIRDWQDYAYERHKKGFRDGWIRRTLLEGRDRRSRDDDDDSEGLEEEQEEAD